MQRQPNKPAFNLSILMLRRKNCKTVSIKQEIDDFHRKYPDRKPLILVDLMHLDQIHTNNRFQRNIRNICGPDLSQLRHIESLLRFLKEDCRAELVFFVDGPKKTNDFRKSERKDDRYDGDIQVIDSVIQDGAPYDGSLRATTDRILFQSMQTMAERYGTIWHPLENRRIMEIARYAFDHNAFAVLGKRAHLLLYMDKFPLKIWYIPDLKVNGSEKKVTEFENADICHGLKLNTQKKRALMAILLPGSVLGQHSLRDDVGALYDYIQKLPSNITPAVLEQVALDLFNGQTNADAMQQAFQLYHYNSVTLSEQKTQYSSYAYDILHDRRTTFTLMLNDLRYWHAMGVNLYQLTVSFYSRLAGILLARNGQHTIETITRQVKAKKDHETPFHYYNIEVVFPEFPVDAIDSEEGSDMLNENCLACIKFCLDLAELPVGRMQQLVGNVENRWKLLDYLTVFFMVQRNMISSHMADMILLAVEQHYNDDECSDINRLPAERNAEAFHALFMYIRWRYYIRELFINSGVPVALIDSECRLDGIRFQNLFNRSLTSRESLEQYGMDFVRKYRLHDEE